jgi:hypothetical protein
MSAISSTAGLAYLTQSGGVLSNLPSGVSASTLKSASPQDVVSLSQAAIEAQQANGLFGTTTTPPNLYGLPVTSSPTTGTNLLPGVSTADLTNATPQENSALNAQALQLQQAQSIFNGS